MGMLTNLADVCRQSGWPVIEVDGWQQRRRGGTGGDSTGGYQSGKPNHIIVHHTASGPSSDGWPDVNYMISSGNSNEPTANLYLARTGEIYVMAAGATNTNGSGSDPCGLVAVDSMNAAAIGIEAGNNGVGETWPDAQLDAYLALCNVLCANYGIGNAQIHSHFEYAPGRKIDPAGPPRYAAGGASWNMGAFRSDVSGGQPGPGPGPGPGPTPPPQDWVQWVMDNQPTLRKGDSGVNVKRMQHLLAAAGFMDEGNVSNYDGQFGGGTEGALNRFKQAAGGGADGTCDSWTWGALMHTVDGIPDIKKGSSGPDVKRMQHLLAANGFMNEGNTSNYDGQWGNGTDTAKAKFDNAHGLTPSPPTDCGSRSWESLLNGWVW